MYRKKLKDLLDGKRHTFYGTFDRTGFKQIFYRDSPIYQPTFVLQHLFIDDHEVTDHLWFNYSKKFVQLGELQPGEIVQFNGRVSKYQKGPYNQRTTDFKLSYPSQVKIIKSLSDDRKDLPDLSNNKNALIGYIMKKNRKFYEANDRPIDGFYLDQYKEWLDNISSN